jgi:prepilin-type N-terminal cleavage/methylation domain-containing protein
MGQNKGFTLIETVMVMVIMSIIAVVIIPKFSSVSVAKLRQEADILKTHLTFAQELSMTRGGGYGLCFDTTNNTYSINKTDCQISSRIKSVEDRVSDFTVKYSSNITISPAGTTAIFFNTFGNPVPNNDYTIVLSAGSNFITLKVEKNTGYVYEL